MNLLAETIGTAKGFCAGTYQVWQLVGRILTIFKIVVPIIIIILGMLDLGKAVMSSKPEEISKNAKSLLFRIIAGLIIFFIPTLVGFIFTIVDSFNSDVKADFNICSACITKPGNSECHG